MRGLAYVRNASGSRRQNQSYIQYQMARASSARAGGRAGGAGRSNG